jgi:glutamate racemase
MPEEQTNNGVSSFNFNSRAGVIEAQETIAQSAMNQKIPVANLNIAMRATNGRVRLAELDMRYQMFVAKTTGNKEVRPIALLEEPPD